MGFWPIRLGRSGPKRRCIESFRVQRLDVVKHFLGRVAGLIRCHSLFGNRDIFIGESVGYVSQMLSAPVADFDALVRLRDDSGLFVVYDYVRHFCFFDIRPATGHNDQWSAGSATLIVRTTLEDSHSNRQQRPSNKNRDRGALLRTPPTPPSMRVRTRRLSTSFKTPRCRKASSHWITSNAAKRLPTGRWFAVLRPRRRELSVIRACSLPLGLRQPHGFSTMPSADFCSHGMSYLIRPAFRASSTHGYACRSRANKNVNFRCTSPPSTLESVGNGFVVHGQLTSVSL